MKLALLLRAQRRSSARSIDLPRARPAHRRPRRASLLNRNTPRAQRAVRQRRQDRPHAAAPATCSSARPRATASPSSAPCSATPSEAARDADTLALLRYGLGRYRVVTAGARAAPALARGRAARRATSEVDLVAAQRRSRRTVAPRRAAARPASSGVPAELDGPLPAGRARRHRRSSASAAGSSARVPLVTAREVARRERLRAPAATALGRPVTLLLWRRSRSVASVWCSCGAASSDGARAASRAETSHDHHRHPQRRDRQVARRAELPARAAPPDRRAAHDGRRQGRQRRAHAQDARPAGDRHGLRRRPDRARGSSSSSPRSRSSTTSCASARSRARTRPSSTRRQRRADRDQRARARRSAPRRSSCSATSCSTSRAAPTSSSSPDRCRAASTPTIYAELIARAAQARRARRSSTPTASRCARPSAPSPTSSRPNVLEAEELVGHEFNDEEDHAIAVARDGPARRARGDHDAARRLRRLRRRSTGAPRSARVWIAPREAVAAVGSGDAFLAGYVAARYSGRSPEDCLRFARGLRRRVDAAPRRRADRRARGRAAGREVEVQRIELPAEVG